VSLLIAGVDETGMKLFETDPTGIYFQYRATAIGEGELEVKTILTKEYKESLTVEEGIKLAISALRKVITDGLEAERIDCVYITADKKSYEKVTKEKIAKILSALDTKDTAKDSSKDSGKDSGKKSKN
jgi:proteasome alpha subunit